jgi:hypothetical protein
MKRSELEAPVRRLLASRRLPALTPALDRLAGSLPRVAEDWAARCLPEVEELRDVLETLLWPAAHKRHEWAPATGWPGIAAACLEAGEVLGIDLEKPFVGTWVRRPIFQMLRDKQAIIGLPRVYVLLRDRAPTRVLLAISGEESEEAEPVIQRCRELARSVVGWPHTPQWRLSDPHAAGTSQMGGLLLRLAAERDLPSWMARSPIGITGELDAAGRFLPVAAIADKVRRFFHQHDDGLCLVPKANWAELKREFGTTSGERARQLDASKWRQLVPVSSLRQLVVCLGHEHGPDAELVAELRRLSGTVTDWRSRRFEAHRLIELSLRPVANQEKSSWPISGDTGLAALVAQARTPGVRGVVLSGLPGSGKSMVMARLFYELNAGELALNGPALLVRARRLGSGVRLTERMVPALRGIDAAQLDAFLASPDWQGCVWLLVDGLDELERSERRSLLEELQAWPGPLVVATRRLRETEYMPDMATFEVAELDSTQRKDLWRLFTGKELVRSPSGMHSASAELEEYLWQDLGRTPLGVSLLAVVQEPTLPHRAALLQQAIKYLIDRAEADGQISAAIRHQLEWRGQLFAGAAAWRMLRAGRAVLQPDDLAWAVNKLDLDIDEEHLLTDGLDASGFLQRIGMDEREFSHKSFAELCAAIFLEQDEKEARDLWPRVGDPEIDEVIIHLAARADNATPYLRHLLNARERPLSSLALAVRVLLECRQDAVDTGVVAALLARRLGVLTWFSEWKLPANLGNTGPLWRVLERWRTQLAPHADRLVAACHRDVQDWLYDEVPRPDEEPYQGSYERMRQTRSMAENLHRTLRFSIPLRNLLRFSHRESALQAQSGDALIRQVALLRTDPEHQVREAAEKMWADLAPVAEVLPYLDAPATHVRSDCIARILQRVVESGTWLEKREALVRAGVAAFDMRYWSASREEYVSVRLNDSRHDVPTARPPSSTAQWLERWSWAWHVGVLGAEAGFDRKRLESLYAFFLHDEVDEARWRALAALRYMHEKSYGNEQKSSSEEIQRVAASVRPMLCDPARAVRIEAAMCLLTLGQTTFASDLQPLCAAVDDSERWVGWHAAVTAGMKPQCSMLVDVLVPRAPRHPGEDPQRPWQDRWRPALTRMEEAMKRHGREARRLLLDWAGSHYANALHHRRYLYSCLDYPQYASVAEEILSAHTSGMDRKLIPLAELQELLTTGRASQRRWAAERLAYDSRPETAAILLPLQKDGDAESATRGRALTERQKREQHASNFEVEPVKVSVEELTIYTIRGYGRFSPNNEQREITAEPFRIHELPRYGSFGALWQHLGKHPLSLTSWYDVDYEGRDDRADHVGLLAEQAAYENLKQIRPIFDRLNELYENEDRTLLLRDLDHPLLGIWAERLLSDQVPQRDLLPLVRRSERCAERVARLAHESTLAPAATHAIIEAAVAGLLPLPKPVEEHEWQYGRVMPPWLEAFVQLAGVEGLVQLLQAARTPEFERWILRYLDRKRDELAARLAAGPRQWFASVLRTLAETGDEVTQTTALRLLSVFGEPVDTEHWAELLRERTLSESLAVAALELLGSAVGSPSHVPLLRELAHAEPSPVRTAALIALMRWGDETDAEWFFSLLRPVDGSHFNNAPKPHEDSRIAVEGVVRLGNRAHAQRLARILLDDTNQRAADLAVSWQRYHSESRENARPCFALEDAALEIAGQYGHWPEHALLIIGALLYDPGDHEYVADVSGFDNVFVEESVVPKQAQKALERILTHSEREDVRRIFLEYLLAGGPSAAVVRNQFDQLGGAFERDIPLIIESLAHRPDSQEALELLARFDEAEQALVEIWERQGCPWWSPP